MCVCSVVRVLNRLIVRLYLLLNTPCSNEKQPLWLKILTLADFQGNSLCTCDRNFHRSFTTLLHYLVKYEMQNIYTVYHKKEPHIFVRRKQTNAYKLVQLSSSTEFCWCCWLAVLKYVACLIFLANNDVKNCVIIYRLPRKGDGRYAQARDTRLHPAVTLAFK